MSGSVVRVGSAWCHAEFGTKAEADAYCFGHEQHCIAFLAALVPLNPPPFRCRIGLHSMKRASVTDGGGVQSSWGYCTRCLCAFRRGNVNFPAALNTFQGSHP